MLKGDPYKRVGAKVAAQLKAAQSINQHATGPKRKVLDYRLANKWDKGQSTVRRQFAASWLWSGRSIKNISKRERKVVKSYVRKYFGKPEAVAGSSGGGLRCCAAVPGQGSGLESLGSGNWNVNLTSCQTAVILLCFVTGASPLV